MIEYELTLPTSIQLQVSSNGTSPFTYLWTLPDGSTSNLASPLFNFTTAGTYNVSVVVTDSTGSTATETFSIIVIGNTSPPPPSSGLSLSLTITKTSNLMMMHFDALATGGISPYKYLLEFGDGNHTTGNVVNHVYASKGTYTAVASVTDTVGNTAHTTETVNV